MKIEVIVAGKPSLKYAKDGVAEYMKRLRNYGSVEIKHIKDGTSEDVSKRLLDVSQGAVRVAMDELGVQLTTSKLHEKFLKWDLNGTKKMCFLIGASDGHTDELRKKADLVLGLSTLTLQHELALVVLLEQIYRVETMKKGHPYHR